MKKTLSKKILAAMLLVAICMPVRSKAVLGVGDTTFDFANLGENIQQALVSVADYTGKVKEWLKTFGLDKLAYNLAQKASQKLVSKVLNKVNGGASQDQPADFVTNFGKYFDDVAGKEVSSFVTELYRSNNPFAKSISIGITNRASGYTSDGLDSFTLGKVIDGDWHGATQDISTAGAKGWNFYSQLAFEQNTPIGASMIAQDELARRQQSADDTARLELTSSGFKPQKAKQGAYDLLGGATDINFNSLESGINNTRDNRCGSANGSYFSSLSASSSNLCKVGTVSGFTDAGTSWSWSCHGSGGSGGLDAECGAGKSSTTGGAGGAPFTSPSCGSADGSYRTSISQGESDLCSSGSVANFSQSGNTVSWSCQVQSGAADASCSAGVSGSGTPYVNDGSGTTGSTDFGPQPQTEGPLDERYSSVEVDKDVQTPASTVGSNVTNAGQEAAKRLQNADEFFKLIFSTLSQLANGLIDKGLSSLVSNAAQAPKNQYGSPTDLASIQNSTNGQTVSWLATPQQIIDLRNDLGTAYEKTTLDVQYNTDLLDLVKQPVTGKILNSAQVAAGAPASDGKENVLQKLETCIPGPDTGWQDRLTQYVADQTKATQARSSQDGEDGINNSNAYRLVNRLTQTAIREEQERIDNSFLNMPASSELRVIVQSYYQKTKQFQTIFTKLLAKRQTASQLATIVAEVKASVPGLTLFDDQWNALSATQKSSLYDSLKTDILANFSADYADPNDPTKLSDLPPDDPATTDVDEHDDAMKARVFAQEWRLWESDTTHITDDQRQNIYKQFVSIESNITDADSLRATKNLRDSVATENTELADALHDCQAISDATLNYAQYPTDADWDTFRNTKLLSSRIKVAFNPNASIIAVAKGTSGLDFSREGEITLPIDIEGEAINDPGDLAAWVDPAADSMVSHGTLGVPQYSNVNTAFLTKYLHWVERYNINQLQVQPAIPLTNDPSPRRQISFGSGQIPATDTMIGVPNPIIQSFFKEDMDGALFCRLPAYMLSYWIPSGITGLPVACIPSHVKEFTSQPHATITHNNSTNPQWYRTNRAEIYYNFSSDTF